MSCLLIQSHSEMLGGRALRQKLVGGGGVGHSSTYNYHSYCSVIFFFQGHIIFSCIIIFLFIFLLLMDIQIIFHFSSSVSSTMLVSFSLQLLFQFLLILDRHLGRLQVSCPGINRIKTNRNKIMYCLLFNGRLYTL